MKVSKILLTFIIILGCLIAITACDPFEQTTGGEHIHAYGANWNSDELSHWKTCTASDCKGETQKTDHSWSNPVTTEPQLGKDGSRVYTCEVCQRTKTEIIPSLEHTHKASEDWIANSEGHWHICDGCNDKLSFATHEWDNGTVVTPPSSGNEGLRRYFCTVCSYAKNTAIPALPNKMSESKWLSHFELENVRVEGVNIIDELGTTYVTILIDGEYAEYISEGESYYSDSATAKGDFDFSMYYDDFNHLGGDLYYAECIYVYEDEFSATLDTVYITFKDGRLESVSYSMTLLGMTCYFEYTFSDWGTISVSVPTLSEDVYLAALNSENFYSYILSVDKYDADGEYTGYVYFFDGDYYELTRYIGFEEYTHSGTEENAGLTMNEAYSILESRLSASDFEYNAQIGAFVLIDPRAIYVEYLAITITDGYLDEVYVIFNDGSEAIYYHSGWGNAEVPDDEEAEDITLTDEDYASLIDPNKYYNYSLGIQEEDPTYGPTFYTYTFDGDNYHVVESTYVESTSRSGVVENAGVQLNFLLTMLNLLSAEDFEYDADIEGFRLIDPTVLKDNIIVFQFQVEDGYIAYARVRYRNGAYSNYTFYGYGTTVVG